MLLALDISNTSIKAGVFNGETLVANWRFATERQKLADDYAMLLLGLFQASGIPASEIDGVSMSCVVPPLRSVFDDLARKYLHLTPLIVGPGIKTGVKLAVDNPREVGADRVVNSLATYRLYGGPAIAIAFGTATVFDCISVQGDYLGGAIAPGVVTSLESLTRSAAQLFQVELVRPPKAIGKSTVTTMQSGVVLGFAGLVEGLVKRLKNELGEAKVIATGGLAEVIAPATDVIDVVDLQLTLKGLKLIYELNQ
ncbi:MAG TPA: type III pantothenate kinase [Anaerolineae bacterium]|nr:type III pantothenate kinase [Anaerolineae bacterium]